MRVFFLLLLYLNKAKAEISFLIPNVGHLQRHEGMESHHPDIQTFCPVWAEKKRIRVPKYERHQGFVGVCKKPQHCC